MIWNTVNVLTIFCAGKIAGKLAWNLGHAGWVLAWYFVHFLVMYL